METDTCHNSLHLSLDVIRCKNIKCNNVYHIAKLEVYYSNINLSLMDTSECILEHQRYTHKPHKIIPGWNKYVRSSHDAAKSFWNNVKKVSTSKIPLPNSLEILLEMSIL